MTVLLLSGLGSCDGLHLHARLTSTVGISVRVVGSVAWLEHVQSLLILADGGIEALLCCGVARHVVRWVDI